MNICGKGNFPECQFFTTGGCVSPSNCIYKIKQDFNTRATSNAMEISRNAEIARLTAENSELRARLDKAVELPVPLETPILKVWKNRVPEDDARMSFVDTWEITTINFKLEHYPLWGKFYFPNTEEGKKAAEARLKEMKEKNNG